MAQKLLQHKHCINCGKAIPLKEEYCSEACTTEHRELIRRKRRQLLILWVGAVSIIVLVFVFGFGV